MPAKKLKEFLDENKVKYVVLTHSTAYTALEIAAAAHIRGKELAKTVMILIDGKMAMAVLPAKYTISFEHLQKKLGAQKIELAAEGQFKDKFPDCEVGAMPPFGNLYGMDVFVDQSLTEDEEIAFNAGSHSELIRMSYGDFARLVKPIVVQFS